jgi:hypothetical protein
MKTMHFIFKETISTCIHLKIFLGMSCQKQKEIRSPCGSSDHLAHRHINGSTWYRSFEGVTKLWHFIYIYSETSLNRTLREPTLPEYRPISKVPAYQFFAKTSLTKRATPLTRPIFLVPVLAGFEKFHCIYEIKFEMWLKIFPSILYLIQTMVQKQEDKMKMLCR